MDGDKELIEKIGRILNGCSCSICILNADKAIALVREHDAAETRVEELKKELAEADFDFGGWRAIKRRLETENAALKREVAMWRSEHDPCPFSLENETLRAEVERLENQIKRFLEPVSDEERIVANHRAGIRCWTKDEVESLIANRLEPKGESDGKR